MVEVTGQVKNGELVVCDALGRTIKREALTGQRAILDLNGVAAGLYYLHLKDQRRWLAGSKLVVE